MTQSRETWYQDAFDEDYLDRYAHRDESEANGAVRLLCRHAKLPAEATMLDLCCGAGRHLAPMRGCGCGNPTVMGGDLSMPLLLHARRTNPQAPLARLDMRRLPFQNASFDLVANFFTAFGYFSEDAENFSVFAEVARVLKPGGWFLFDFLNARVARRQVEAAPAREVQELANGEKWEILRHITPDGRRAEKHLRPLHAGGREQHESVRLFSCRELSDALCGAGFGVEHLFGDYAGAPFAEESSPRALFVCRQDAVGGPIIDIKP